MSTERSIGEGVSQARFIPPDNLEKSASYDHIKKICPGALRDEDKWYPRIEHVEGITYQVPHWSMVMDDKEEAEAQTRVAWNQFTNVLDNGAGYSVLKELRNDLWERYCKRVEAIAEGLPFQKEQAEMNIFSHFYYRQGFRGRVPDWTQHADEDLKRTPDWAQQEVDKLKRLEDCLDNLREKEEQKQLSELLTIMQGAYLSVTRGLAWQTALIAIRLCACSSVHDRFLTWGNIDRWEELTGKEFEGEVRNGEVSSRGKQYLKAVLKLAGKDYDNSSQFFEAISVRAPKPDGTAPSLQAVWEWFKANGYVQNGQDLSDFRPTLKSEAERLSEEGAL